VSTRSVVTTALVLIGLGFVSPVHAQETTAAASNSALIIQWSIITSGFASMPTSPADEARRILQRAGRHGVGVQRQQLFRGCILESPPGLQAIIR